MNQTSQTPQTPDTSLSTTIQLAGFVGDSIVDGPGLRCTLFCQGCPHGCAGCHNPETHPFEGGKPVSAQMLYQQIRQYPLCKGVTFSGGEPFCQAKALLPLAQKLRQNGFELATYTGYTFEELYTGTPEQQALLACLDTLIDGPYQQQHRNLKLRFRGSQNQRILNIPQSLASGKPVAEQAPRWTGTT